MKTQIPRGRITGYTQLPEGLRLNFEGPDGRKSSYLFHTGMKADRQALKEYLSWRVRKLSKTARFSKKMSDIEIIEALIFADKIKSAAK